MWDSHTTLSGENKTGLPNSERILVPPQKKEREGGRRGVGEGVGRRKVPVSIHTSSYLVKLWDHSFVD